MKKIINYIFLFLLVFSFNSLYSCIDDESSYEAQIKEKVEVDEIVVDKDSTATEPHDGILVPGMHTVKLDVLTLGEDNVEVTVKRRFKYFMPISIDASKPISLIFEFHGSWLYEGENAPDPLENISIGNPLCQHAIKENCIIVFPAGEDVKNDDGGAVNWQNSEKHLPFVDEMVKYFKNSTPQIDINRIYSTGQSSGAIFSFVLAFERSEVFAAITPRAGQMNIDSKVSLPTRAVPIRVFSGINDNIVQHEAVIQNMTTWAKRIGGYFENDMIYTQDSIEISNYKIVDTRIWSGGNTDLQIFCIQDEGHGVVMSKVLPYMWTFMQEHTLDNSTTSYFVTSEVKEIDAQCGQSIEFNINYSDGAMVRLENIPESWNPIIEGKVIKMLAPSDFFANIQRKGIMKLIAEKDGEEKSLEISYNLNAPKTYFEVGDLYYDKDFNVVGIVFWVNKLNIKEAKIVNLEEVTTAGSYQTINFGNFGNTFVTPNYEDGKPNTDLHIKENIDKELGLTENNSALVWAYDYSYKNEDSWYLPALNELKALGNNIADVNKSLGENDGEQIQLGRWDSYLSSTVTLKDSKKCFHMYNFGTLSESEQVKTNTSYFRARAIKKVTK